MGQYEQISNLIFKPLWIDCQAPKFRGADPELVEWVKRPKCC